MKYMRLCDRFGLNLIKNAAPFNTKIISIYVDFITDDNFLTSFILNCFGFVFNFLRIDLDDDV